MCSNGPIPTHPHLLQALFDEFPLGIVLSDGWGRILRSNAMAQELLGLPADAQQERDIAGPQWDIVRLDGSPMPAAEFASVRALTEGCVVRDVEMGVARPDGGRIWLSVTAAPVEEGLVAITFENIGPRIRGAAVMQAHGRLVERAEELGLEAMLRATLDELETLTGSCIGFYHFVLEDQETLHLQAWSTRTEAEFCRAEGKGAHCPVGQAGIWADAVREKRPVIHNDYASAPGKRGLPEGHAVVLRELVVPVLRNGQVRAVLGVGNKPTPYDDGDVASVQRLANLAWELAALKLARLAAERRAEQIETVSASAPGLIHAFRLGPDGRLTLPFLSAAAEDLYGLEPATVAADFHAVLDRSPAEDRERLWEAGMASARDLSPYHQRWRYDHPAKGLRWLENWSKPRREPDGGTLWHGITMDTTALVEAEQALRQSEARLESAFAHSPHGMALVDLDGRYLKVNHAFWRMLGWSEAEVLAKGLRGLTHPDDLPRDLQLVHDLLAGRVPSCQVEKRYLHRDGHDVWAQVNVSLLHDADGSPLHFVSQMLDITARRQADRERTMTLEILQVLNQVDGLEEAAALILEIIQREVGVEAAAIRLPSDDDIGYAAHRGFPEAFIQAETCLRSRDPRGQPLFGADGQPLFDCTCGLVLMGRTDPANPLFTAGGSAWTNDALPFLDLPAEQDPRLAPRNRCIHAGYRSVALVPIRARDAIVGLLQLNDPRPNRFTADLVAFLEGISTSIGIAILRRRTQEALRQSESRHRMLAENASDVIWTMDLEGRFTYVSPSIQRLRGYTAEEVMSQSFLDALTPESAQIAAREYARSLEVLAAGGAFPAFRGEMEQPCKDGSTVWTEVTTTGLHDEAGHLVGVLGVSRDITARRKAEEVLRDSEARFRQISEASGDWIWEVDADGRYTYSSQGIERFLGYRPEDLVGRARFWDLWPAAEREALLPAVQEVFRNRAPIRNLPNTALHKDGRRVRLETTGLPIHGPGGEFLGYRGVDHDVTEREASQEALRLSEERFSKAFHQNPVPMAIARAADQRMLEVNDSWVKLSGMTREMAVGEVLAETRLIPDAEERAKLQRSFNPSEPLHALPIRIVRQDGQPRTVHLSAQLALLGGEPCVLISAQDVSEQVRAEEALRESAFHLREAQKLAQVGHWTVDHRTGTTRWSEQLYAIHGRDPALPPPAWEEFQRSFHPEDLAAMRSNYEGHLASRNPSAHFGYRIILADGRVRHVRSECRTEYDDEGRPLRTFGTDQDITDLVRTQVALQESEGRFRGLWEHAPVAVMEEDYSAVKARCDAWSREGVGNLATHLELHPQAALDLAALVRVVEVNSATLRLFGASDAEALVRGLPDCFGEDALPAFKAHLAALYAGQQSTEHESSARDLQGRQLNLQVRISVVPGHEQDLGRVLVSFSDLTERKATEADRRRLERELNHLQRLESLGRLAGGVSHDMNNVLGAIMAVGSLLKVRHRDNPAIVKDAEALLQAAIRGRDLVKGLRDFSRKELESATELDLNDLALREADLLERTTLKRVAVDLDLAPELAKVYGEASTISNALMNLCLNACDAMPHGGTVTLSTRNLGEGFVEVAVQDTGEGMPPDVLARATEPFFTTKPAGKGTGLGLSQVYGTMKAHGGTLDIQSRLGRGTRVSLSFPVSTAAQPATPDGEAGAAVPPRTLRILLVDDEELIRRTFMLLLEAMGHEVQTASGGLDALRRVEAGLEADLAVLDVNMPGMDGLETLSRLRILRPELPVVIATGFADERIPGILRRFPKVRILKKPFGISDLEKLLSAWP